MATFAAIRRRIGDLNLRHDDQLLAGGSRSRKLFLPEAVPDDVIATGASASATGPAKEKAGRRPSGGIVKSKLVGQKSLRRSATAPKEVAWPPDLSE